ncbi:hypothetical protein [Leisingera sp. S232]|uniref:hypothetical protein n=1 Tax=Leisingera sp. S232 TaxID=3415132 RepID=UPI003C7A7CD5
MLNPDQNTGPSIDTLCQRATAPRVDLARMLRAHGYRQPDRIPKKVMAEAERARANAETYAEPQSFFRIVKIESLSGGKLALKDGPTLTCAAFDHCLNGCTEVCIFVTTLGDKLDGRIKACMGEADFQPLEALFLGTFGWLMIEAVTREMMRDFKRDMAAHGQSLTLRMGPGYSYRQPGRSERAVWDLTEQAALLSIFDDVDLPIKLTPGFSMKPTMTRSGLAGLKFNSADRPAGPVTQA